MNIAYLVLAHKNPTQINRLITALSYKNNTFFIHLDKKVDFLDDIFRYENVHISQKRHSISWGEISMVDATIDLCTLALNNPRKFDYYVLLSGQDYPIHSNEYIENYLNAYPASEYFDVKPFPVKAWEHHDGGFDRIRVFFPKFMIDRRGRTKRMRDLWIYLSKKMNLLRKPPEFEGYFGVSQWFAATEQAMAYMVSYLDHRPDLLNFFKNTMIPDEVLFNTIIMNSPFRENVRGHNLTYWELTNDPKENPKIWRIDDAEFISSLEYPFIRKLDIEIDSDIFDKIDENRAIESVKLTVN